MDNDERINTEKTYLIVHAVLNVELQSIWLVVFYFLVESN